MYKPLKRNCFFSPSGFYSSLIYNLNAYNILNDPSVSLDAISLELSKTLEILTPEFEKRIKKLSLITNESKLHKNFPFLYKSYKVEKEYNDNLLETEKKINDKKLNPQVRFLMKRKFEATYKEKGLDIDADELFKKAKKFNITNYCKELSISFRKLIESAPDILNYMFTHSIDIEDLVIDKESLELYIVNQFMINAEVLSDTDSKQRYIYYISNYFRENKERKTSTTPKIRVGSVNNENIPDYKKTDGVIVTPPTLFTRSLEK